MGVGRGSVYKQKGKDGKLGSVWWVQWYRDGRRFRESSGSSKKTEAQAHLSRRLGDVSRGAPVLPRYDRLTFDDAAQDVVNDYRLNAKRSIDGLERRLRKHLKPYFSGRRMVSITTAEVRAYIVKRQGDVIVTKARAGQPESSRPVSNGEINRELSILKRIFRLAVEGGRLLHRPHIRMLDERNTRRGFLDADQLKAICDALPEALSAVVRFAYATGWRTHSEVLPLEWRNVDWAGRCVRLDAHTTKNGEARVFPFTADIEAILTAQLAEHERLQADDVICPYVFHRNGKQIVQFRKAWKNACTAAGCPDKLIHDMRRSAVRTFERAGVPRSVAMSIIGHKTESIYLRYAVVDESLQKEAAARIDAFLSAPPPPSQTGGEVKPFTASKARRRQSA